MGHSDLYMGNKTDFVEEKVRRSKLETMWSCSQVLVKSPSRPICLRLVYLAEKTVRGPASTRLSRDALITGVVFSTFRWAYRAQYMVSEVR